MFRMSMRILEVAYRDEKGLLKTKDVLQYSYYNPPSQGNYAGAGGYSSYGTSSGWIDVPRVSLEQQENKNEN